MTAIMRGIGLAFAAAVGIGTFAAVVVEAYKGSFFTLALAVGSLALTVAADFIDRRKAKAAPPEAGK